MIVLNEIDDVPSRKPRIAVLVDEDLLEYLQQWAESEERSLSNLVLLLIKQAVEEKKAETSAIEHKGK